jgi:hypothetical protein
MKRTANRRWLGLGGVALLALILVSLFAAPHAATLQQGSTYSRVPGGYGAWYAYMKEQGIPIQRWQKPLDQLFHPSQPSHPLDQAVPIRFSTSVLDAIRSPITFVQITPNPIPTGFSEEWVSRGNVLIKVGERATVTAAPFSSNLKSAAGRVKIETSRRHIERVKQPEEEQSSLLSDAFGDVVWEVSIGKGRIIYVSTPYLAANAYQKESGNFKFLMQLVTEPNHQIYVDEYLHGYKDKAVIAQETAQGLITYLAKTPLVLVAVQTSVILLVLIWGQNQRLGRPVKLTDPAVDNSKAYVQALASVLQKASCSEFVVETVGKAEQLQVQRSLGLGPDLFDPEAVIAAWVQQTGRPASELEDLLNLTQHPRQLNERGMLVWLSKMQAVRRTIGIGG